MGPLIRMGTREAGELRRCALEAGWWGGDCAFFGHPLDGSWCAVVQLKVPIVEERCVGG